MEKPVATMGLALNRNDLEEGFGRPTANNWDKGLMVMVTLSKQ